MSEFHQMPMRGWLLPHAHVIVEDWPDQKKNRLADHIEFMHSKRTGL